MPHRKRGQEAFLTGDEQAIWHRYCGFLDLSTQDFLYIQERLLLEQLGQMQGSSLARHMIRGKWPRSIDEYRRLVPFTTYQDYAPMLFGKDGSILAENPRFWSHTTVAGGQTRWVPLTQRAYDVVADATLATLILACARRKGDVKLTSEHRILYSVAPRPYLSGFMAHAMKERFGFDGIPSPDESDSLPFEELLEQGFQRALASRVDVLVAMTSVLLRVGERFEEKGRRSGLSWRYLQPQAMARLALAFLRSRLEGRPVLPRDLWPVKAVVGWGTDTQLYRHKIREYWGQDPIEFYACTEAGIVAIQSWTRKGMTFLPNAAFLEFVPEGELRRRNGSHTYAPATVLLDGLEAGKRYEVVISSFHGLPFLRYRLGHLIRVVSAGDPEAGVSLPQIEYVGRTDEVIDIAGFTRLDERTLAQALAESGVPHREWVARRESAEGRGAVLHLYTELAREMGPAEVKRLTHESLKRVDPCYRDLEHMLGLDPLRVTVLPVGTFDRYQQREGPDGTRRGISRLARLNICEEALAGLLGARDAREASLTHAVAHA